MKKEMILNGIHIGEHSFEPEKIIDEIKTRCIDYGFNYVSLRPRGEEFSQEYFVDWASFLAQNKIYFSFNYLTQFSPEGKESRIDAKTVKRVKEIAGEYFLGELHGEPGSMYACKLPGYYLAAAKDMLQTGKEQGKIDPTQYRSIYRNFRLQKYDDMKQAHEGYIRQLSEFTDVNKKYGMPNILCVDASGFAKYNAEAGVNIPVLEICPGNPDVLVPIVRGVARAFDSKLWGTFAAHEWYGGLRHDDPLKMKRLELTYKYAFLSGSQMFLLESGDTGVSGYGQVFEEDSEVCLNYKRVLREMQEYISSEERPAGGPKVKVAFVSGLHDGWAGKWGRSCLFNQFYREEWGYNEAEHSWMLLDEIYGKRVWGETENYGKYDTSSSPAYGLYDIVPIEADVDHLSRYDYLIFLGWNTMTEENMDKLTEYVRRGGHLVMSAAHLNTQTKRGAEYQMISDEKVEQLFGCRFMGEIRRTVSGANFKYDSLDENVMYPIYRSGGCDPMFAAGYADYARFAVCEGKTIAYASDSFAEKLSDLPMVIENKLGDGVATLVTNVNYPGNPAVFLLYRAVVREMISASSRACDIKVIGSDRVRWSVYEGNKIYLLNTDYDMPIIVKIIHGDNEKTVTLQSLELTSVQV